MISLLSENEEYEWVQHFSIKPCYASNSEIVFWSPRIIKYSTEEFLHEIVDGLVFHTRTLDYYFILLLESDESRKKSAKLKLKIRDKLLYLRSVNFSSINPIDLLFSFCKNHNMIGLDNLQQENHHSYYSELVEEHIKYWKELNGY